MPPPAVPLGRLASSHRFIFSQLTHPPAIAVPPPGKATGATIGRSRHTIGDVRALSSGRKQLRMLQETEGLLVSNDARGSTTTFLRGTVPLGAAAGYGAASVVATLSNKALLSSWQFDCVFSLLLLQNVLTVLLLHVASRTRHRNALRLNFAVEPSSWVRLVAPVSVISLLNVLCGLWALKLSSVPIYQTLKRMSPLPAML